MNISENNLHYYQNCIRSSASKAEVMSINQLRFYRVLNYIKNWEWINEENLSNKLIKNFSKIEDNQDLLVFFCQVVNYGWDADSTNSARFAQQLSIEQRAKIAKLAAKTNPHKTSRSLANYQLNSRPDLLLEIAREAGRDDPEKIVHFIKDCQFSETNLSNLLKTIIHVQPKLLIHFQEESDYMLICQSIREEISPIGAKSRKEFFSLESVISFSVERLKIEDKAFLLKLGCAVVKKYEANCIERKSKKKPFGKDKSHRDTELVQSYINFLSVSEKFQVSFDFLPHIFNSISASLDIDIQTIVHTLQRVRASSELKKRFMIQLIPHLPFYNSSKIQKEEIAILVTYFNSLAANSSQKQEFLSAFIQSKYHHIFSLLHEFDFNQEEIKKVLDQAFDKFLQGVVFQELSKSKISPLILVESLLPKFTLIKCFQCLAIPRNVETEIVRKTSYPIDLYFKEMVDARYNELNGSVEEINSLNDSPALRPFLNEIKNQPNLIIRQGLIKWAFFVVTSLQNYKFDEKQIKKMLPALKALLHHRSPQIRLYLTPILLEIMQNQSVMGFKCLEEFAAHPHTLPIGLFAYKLKANDDSIKSILNDVREWKDKDKIQLFVNLLYLLDLNEAISLEEKHVIIKKVFIKESEEKNDNLTDRMQLVESFLYLKRNDILKKFEIFKSLKEKLQDVFNEEFEVKKSEHFLETYHQTLGKFRQQTAIFTYLGNLKKIANLEDREEALKAFKGFIQQIFAGNFLSNRNDAKRNSHLNAVAKFDPDLLREWQEGALYTDVELRELDETKSGKQFLDEVLTYEEKQNYPLLCEIENASKLSSAVKFALEKNKLEMTAIINKTNKSDRSENKTLNLQLKKLKLQQYLLDLYNKDLSSKEGQDILMKIEQFLTANSSISHVQFHHHIKNQLRRVHYHVYDMDSPEDLLLSGTDSGTCMRIDGDPNKCKCLLSYLLDGKNRLIAIKDDEGKTIARCILRLMIDEKLNMPILYQEHIYVSHGRKDLIHLISTMCKRRAKDLKLPLLSAPTEEACRVYANHSVKSVGGVYSCDYFNGPGEEYGVKPFIFTIKEFSDEYYPPEIRSGHIK